MTLKSTAIQTFNKPGQERRLKPNKKSTKRLYIAGLFTIETVSINLLFHCFSLMKFFGSSAQPIRSFVQGIFLERFGRNSAHKTVAKNIRTKIVRPPESQRFVQTVFLFNSINVQFVLKILWTKHLIFRMHI